jgi:2-hydroxymuconate-semialdehyde hydrolase
MSTSAEIGLTVRAGGIATNYHQAGGGYPLLLLHGSGPGVTGWANWRLNMPDFAKTFNVFAPDLVGFGFTERPQKFQYGYEAWVSHLIGFMDALAIPRAHIVGNSFGGGVALALTVRHPERVGKLVLMGSAGINFELTEGLDFVWGYVPSKDNMLKVMRYLAYDQSIVKEEIAQLRYEASIRPGVQESYAALFPTPRQRAIEKLAIPEDKLRAIASSTLIIHGREDRVVPYQSSIRLHELVGPSQLHLFGQCGHWTQIERLQEFNDLVVNFLKQQSDR